MGLMAGEEETADGEDPGADLSTLRWAVKDTFTDGITFYGRVTAEGWLVEARRLAGVPVRFALVEVRRFGTLVDLVAGVLASGTPYFLGPERRSLAGEPPSVTVGEHPVFASADPASSPVACFRKLSREEFEIEVPWKTEFAAWSATKPIL